MTRLDRAEGVVHVIRRLDQLLARELICESRRAENRDAQAKREEQTDGESALRATLGGKTAGGFSDSAVETGA